MSDNIKNEQERSEIELLLPWYVTGKLDAADAARVQAYLHAHPDMKRQLALIREERDQSASDNEALAGPAPVSIDRVLASVGHDRRTPASLSNIWDRLGAYFAGSSIPAEVRWAGIAAGALLLIQAAVIGSLLLSRSPDSYQTASGKHVPASGSTLLVGFADGATAPAIAALLSDLDAQIIEGPKPGGMYRVRLAKSPASEAERQDIVRKLLGRTDVVKVVLLGAD